MRYKSIVILSILTAVLLAAAFGVGRASATTGCFNDTNGNWAESFICWMKDNGISAGYPDGGYHPNANVTRAEMAVFLKAQAEIPPSTGDIYVSVGPTNWVASADNNGKGFVSYHSSYADLKTTTTGSQSFLLQPVLPVGLYGRQMNLKGVKFCYYVNTVVSGHVITQVNLKHETGGFDLSLASQTTDSTGRLDMACREYDLYVPTPLQGTDIVTLSVTVNFTNTAYGVQIYNTVFILTPSTASNVLGGPAPDVGSGQ